VPSLNRFAAINTKNLRHAGCMAEDGVFLAFLQETEHHDWGIFIDFRALAGSIMPGTYISSTGLSENRLWRPSDPLSAGSLGRNGAHR